MPRDKSAKQPTEPGLPKIAIVIDDLGHDKETASEFIALDAPLTLAFLPQARYAREMSLLAKNQGKEVLLHLPMEPHNYPKTNPGPGALLVDMAEEDVRSAIERAITEFPFALGANNHMGSRFTENREKMAITLNVLKKHGLYFMDSLTTPNSAGPSVALEIGVPCIQRNVFLDNEVFEDSIKQQVSRLVQQAQTKGKAVGSAHPYPLSLKVLRESLPSLKKKVEIVSLSRLLP